MTTIDKMTPSAKRLLDAARKLKHCQDFADIGRLLGESDQTMTNWKKRGVPKKKTVHICTIIGCRPEWLEAGREPMCSDDNTLSIDANRLPPSGLHVAEKRVNYNFERNVESGPLIRGEVPLISWVQAGDWSGVVDNFSPGECEMPVPSPVPVKRHTYALKVQGDSMTNPNGWPSFPEGMIIIVEPEMDFEPGNFVVVKNGDDEATFKQLVKDGGDWFLKPLNPRYPIKPMPTDAVICGVVRGVCAILC